MSAIDATTLALLGLNPDKPSATLGRRAGSRIRLLHASSGNAPAPRPAEDRRRSPRVTPDLTGIAEVARMRPGMNVRVVDIGPKGVLIESPVRLHIGLPVELVFVVMDTQMRLQMACLVRRCQVAGLDPIVYRGALEFERELPMEALQPFIAAEVRSA